MSDCFYRNREVCSKTDEHEGNACPLSRLALHRVDSEFGLRERLSDAAKRKTAILYCCFRLNYSVRLKLR